MINFIKDNRFSKFLDKLTAASRYQTSTYIDLSPNDIFDGEIGTILVKNESDILYKTNTDEDFTNLSALFPHIVSSRKYLLERGLNKRATWIKNSTTTQKTWKFLGFTCPFDSMCDTCIYTAPTYYYFD